MAEHFKSLVLLFTSPKCYDEFFVNFNFFDVPCLKSVISKALGYGIILGSLLVKLPQIIKLYQNKSGEGLSFSSILLELTAITANAAYSFRNAYPFSAWGEALFLAVQTVIVGALVLHYSGSASKAVGFVLSYLLTFSTLISGLTPMSVLWCLQACNVPVVLGAKLLQAHANYSNQSTGQLSALTVCMLFFGSFARVFTSIQETGDPVVIITYTCGALGNGLIASQLWYYNKYKSVDSSKKSK